MPYPQTAYQVTTPQRTSRPTTTQQPARYRSTSPFRATPPPPPSLTTQPASYYKPTSPFRSAPSLPKAALPVAKFLSKVPKGGGAALAIAFELLFPPPAGDNYYDRNPKNPPPKYKLHPPEPPKVIEPLNYPFQGGQEIGAIYEVTIEAMTFNPSIQNDELKIFSIGTCYGPIVSVDFNYSSNSSSTNTIYYITSAGLTFSGYYPKTIRQEITNQTYVKKPSIRIVNLRKTNGQPDTGGNPPPTNSLLYSPPGNSLGSPIPAPPSFAPLPAPSSPPSTAPSPSPRGPGTTPGGTPEPKRHPGPVPSPAPTPNGNPRDAPQPERYPGPFPSPSPAPAPNGNPGPAPGSGVGPSLALTPTPIPANTPSTSPPPSWQRINRRGPVQLPSDTPTIPHAPLTPGAPFTTDPNPGRRDPRFVPLPFRPNPTTGNPEPIAPLVARPPTTPVPLATPTDDLRKQIDKYLGPITIAIAGITGLVQPDALKNAARAGTCQAFAPGGCAAPVANNAQAAANNSANNGAGIASIMAFLQALQAAFMAPILAGVNLINTKLGPVMAGANGIGGFLARTAEAAKIDKVLNAMNTVLLLHNAAMLSRNLGSTLGDLTSQALATIGIKDGDSPIDVNEILGKQANNFMSTILGAEVWAGTKTSWNKASSIIASATNLMYTVRSMFDSTREILEWTAENTGKIGNALKRFRIVGENAYKWLPERVTVQNRFTQRLDKIREGTDSLDDAASSLSGVLGEVQSIQSEYADLQEQKQKFDANIQSLTPKPREENKPVSDSVVAAKNASAAPTGTENVFRGEGEKLDA